MIRADTCTTTELQPRRRQINDLHRGFQSICDTVDGIDSADGVYRGSESVKTDLQYLVRSLSIANYQMDRKGFQVHGKGLMLDKILNNLRDLRLRDVEIVESDLGDNGSVITDIIESYISRNCSRTCSLKSVSRACSVRTGSVSSRSVTSDSDQEDEVVFLDRNCHMGNRSQSFLDLIGELDSFHTV